MSGADMERLQAEMTATYKREGTRITAFKLTPDSATQVSGMIHVEIPTGTGSREYFTTCIATLNRTTHRFDWHCDPVP